MGLGDELLGSGIARGAAARGKRIAFGDGRRILWHRNAHEVFRNNPNVAQPGSERAKPLQLEWVKHYTGNRLYAQRGPRGWVFDPKFRAIAGEVFFDQSEIEFAASLTPGFIVIEPTIKPQSPNKQWPIDRYQEIAAQLAAAGYRVVQLGYGGELLPVAARIKTATFRLALAALSRAALYIGPEGGLHHGAAAVGIPAVVLFGGFISPQTTGYPSHVNLFTGRTACGMTSPCHHCRDAMDAITVEQVLLSANELLEQSTHCAVNL